MIEWREVPGYPSYSVSNEGVVARTTRAKTSKEKVLNPTIDKDGYKHISLMNEGKRGSFLVHRLVLLAFVGDSTLHTHHINGNCGDNRLENLRYISPSDHGRHHHQKGVRSGTIAKLTDEQAISLREEYAAEVPTELLTKKYRICKAAVCNVVTGKTYKNIGGPRTIRGTGWRRVKL